jgi:hypothetical protein
MITSLPIRPYDINLLTAERAKLVTGPVVSSDLITSRNGPVNIDKKAAEISYNDTKEANRFVSL